MEEGISRYRGKSSEGILERMKDWAEDLLSNGLPLHVEEIKIYPDKMSLSTLQFTERLGYRQKSAIEMITMGCYNTLWTLRNHLESLKPQRCDEDGKSLDLARKWMGIPEWPRQSDKDADRFEVEAKLEMLHGSWQCTRQECLFHNQYCLHGAKTNPKTV